MSAMEEEVVDDGASGVSRCARRLSLGLSHPLSTPHHHGARDESYLPANATLTHLLTHFTLAPTVSTPVSVTEPVRLLGTPPSPTRPC
jgi:hypothetical protein